MHFKICILPVARSAHHISPEAIKLLNWYAMVQVIQVRVEFLIAVLCQKLSSISRAD